MSSPRNPELYWPASDGEVLDFSRKLDRICVQSAGADGYHNEILVDSSVTLADRSIQTVRFKAIYLGEVDVYSVTWSHAVAMANIWQPVKSDGSTISGDETNLQYKPGNFQIFDPDIDEKVEGYLESERQLNVRRYYGRPERAEADLEYGLNLVNETFTQIERFFGYAPGAVIGNDKLTADDIERIVESGEPVLDTDASEFEQSLVTRADLIVAASMLRLRGIMNPSTVAYRGAPLTIDDYTGLAHIEDI